MPRPKDTSYTGDPEYTQFEQMISDRKLCPATAKSYKASYRKCRNLFQKPIRDTAEDTAWKTIRVPSSIERSLVTLYAVYGFRCGVALIAADTQTTVPSQTYSLLTHTHARRSLYI